MASAAAAALKCRKLISPPPEHSAPLLLLAGRARRSVCTFCWLNPSLFPLERLPLQHKRRRFWSSTSKNFVNVFRNVRDAISCRLSCYSEQKQLSKFPSKGLLQLLQPIPTFLALVPSMFPERPVTPSLQTPDEPTVGSDRALTFSLLVQWYHKCKEDGGRPMLHAGALHTSRPIFLFDYYLQISLKEENIPSLRPERQP